MQLRRLHPDPDDVSPEDAVTGLELDERAPDERPYVVANLVSTVDGRTTIDGRSDPIGDRVDRRLFHLLRTQADALLVGTDTLRKEGYGRLIKDPDLRSRREAEGRAAEPILCVVTRSGEVPWDIPFFDEAGSRAAVYTGTAVAGAPDSAAEVSVTLMDDGAQPAGVLARLRSDHGVRSVLCEGGPALLGALAGAGLLDELFLSLAPKLAGDPGALTLLGAPMPEPEELELISVFEAAGTLYLRYRLAHR